MQCRNQVAFFLQYSSSSALKIIFLAMTDFPIPFVSQNPWAIGSLKQRWAEDESGIPRQLPDAPSRTVLHKFRHIWQRNQEMLLISSCPTLSCCRRCASLIPLNKYISLHFLDLRAWNVCSSSGTEFQSHMLWPRTILSTKEMFRHWCLHGLLPLPFSPATDPHAGYIHQEKHHKAFVYIMLNVSMFCINHET